MDLTEENPDFLRAQLGEVERMLDNLHASAITSRFSLESRRRALRRALGLPELPKERF